MNARREDTRRKIELGGLVIKSGISGESAAVVLGALALAARALKGQDADSTRARLQAAGDALFREKEDGTE
jgi:hypothetical protein